MNMNQIDEIISEIKCHYPNCKYLRLNGTNKYCKEHTCIESGCINSIKITNRCMDHYNEYLKCKYINCDQQVAYFCGRKISNYCNSHIGKKINEIHELDINEENPAQIPHDKIFQDYMSFYELERNKILKIMNYKSPISILYFINNSTSLNLNKDLTGHPSIRLYMDTYSRSQGPKFTISPHDHDILIGHNFDSDSTKIIFMIFSCVNNNMVHRFLIGSKINLNNEYKVFTKMLTSIDVIDADHFIMKDRITMKNKEYKDFADLVDKNAQLISSSTSSDGYTISAQVIKNLKYEWSFFGWNKKTVHFVEVSFFKNNIAL